MNRERMTEADARDAFYVMAREIGWGPEFVLQRQRPGDGVDRYRVETTGGRLPLGRRFWLGAREATVAMLAIYYYEQERKEQG